MYGEFFFFFESTTALHGNKCLLHIMNIRVSVLTNCHIRKKSSAYDPSAKANEKIKLRRHCFDDRCGT